MADSSSADSQGIAHLSYTCPGLHDKGNRQIIGRKTFQQLLVEAQQYQIVIPLFQRTYCWTVEPLIAKWWSDVLHGNVSVLCGKYSTGKAVFKVIKDGGSKILVVIDGQQRLTTELLLLAALRDVVMEEAARVERDSNEWSELVPQIESRLYRDHSEATKWHEILQKLGDDVTTHWAGFHPMSSDFKFSLLVPSLPDRLHFLELLCRKKATANCSPSTRQSCMGQAKQYFDDSIRTHLDKCRTNAVKLEKTDEILHAVLNKMSVMSVEIVNEINFAQVFLWYQEKTLLAKALLHNDNPGVEFRACDLLRNLLLSNYMQNSLREQEKIYRELWFEKIERNNESPVDLDKKLAAFLVERFGKDKKRHRSSFETTFAGCSTKIKISGGILLYAQFYSYYEKKLMDAQMMPPPQSSSSSSSSSEERAKVCREIIEDLSTFLQKEL